MFTAPPVGSLWRRSDFLKLWAAQAVSTFGSRIAREGLPLAAVLTINAQPTQLGVLAAMATGPAVIVGLAAGGWVDRARRRRLLIGADLARAAILLSIPVLALLHKLSMVQIYIAAALVGAASVLFDIADHAFLPSLIAHDRLVEGNSKLGATESISEIAGPALAGVLFQAVTAPVAITANAITYLVSAAFLGAIEQRETARPASDVRAPWTADLTSGLGTILSHPEVRPLFLMGLTQALFGAFFASLYVVFAIRTLDLTPSLLGMTIAVGGVGALAGAVLAPVLAGRLGYGPTIIATSFGAGLSTLLIPFAQGGRTTGTLMLMAAQLFDDSLAVTASVLAVSLRQSLLPPLVLGRTGAIFHAGQGGFAVVGALAGGWLGAAFGPRVALVAAAIGLSFAPMFAFASPLRGLRHANGGSAGES